MGESGGPILIVIFIHSFIQHVDFIHHCYLREHILPAIWQALSCVPFCKSCGICSNTKSNLLAVVFFLMLINNNLFVHYFLLLYQMYKYFSGRVFTRWKRTRYFKNGKK